jgi:hypothetical protein
MKVLPTFLVIGAMKAGTTSLYHYLESHPEVCMSSIKETNFFLGENDYKRGIDWYSSLFKKTDEKVFGEASVNYTKRHRWDGVPELIKKEVPDVKLIYLVRDPIERAVSHYMHNVAQGREKKTFTQALVPQSHYLKTSLYYYQIEAYIKYFDFDKILFVESSELLKNTQKTLIRVFNFLEISENVNINNINERYHLSSEKKMKSILEAIIKSNKIKKIIKPILPAFITQNKPLNIPVLDETHIKTLREYLMSDINKFRELTGERFDCWSV